MVKVSVLALAFAALVVAAPSGDKSKPGKHEGEQNGGDHIGEGHLDGEFGTSTVSIISTTTVTTMEDAFTTSITTTNDGATITTTNDGATITITTTTTMEEPATTITTSTPIATTTMAATLVPANFDDIAALPGTQLQPVGLYNNIYYQEFNLVDEGNYLNNVDGIVPNTAPNAIGYGIQAQNGGAKLRRQTAGASAPALLAGTMGSTASYFSLGSFFFGCAVSTTNATSAVAVSCTIQATGYLNGTQVAQQLFSFAPSGSPARMVSAAPSANFQAVDQVQFATQGGNSSLTAVLFDSLVYTTFQMS